jgi:hypothetical protein
MNDEFVPAPFTGRKIQHLSHQSLVQSRPNLPPEMEIPRSHKFTNLLTHIIFSTKDRTPVITPEIKPRLDAHAGGMIRQLNGCPLTIHETAESAAP